MGVGCPTLLGNMEYILYDVIFDMRIKNESNEGFSLRKSIEFVH